MEVQAVSDSHLVFSWFPPSTTRISAHAPGATNLQQAASGGADVCHRLVLYDGDQQGCEQDVCHLSVEEVYSVVGLGHHGGLVPAGGVVLHALQRVASGGAKETRKTIEGHIGQQRCRCAEEASTHT